MRIPNGVIVYLGLLSTLCTAPMASAGPKVYLGERTVDARRPGLAGVDHSLLNHLFRRFVDNNGMVDYTRWRADRHGIEQLDEYLALVGSVNLEKAAAREAVLAYWINVYNALTIRGILREYPTRSIKDHAHPRGYYIWRDLLLWVDNEPISLDEMENSKLRVLGEPRIHFALVCAARGCPKLRQEIYTPEKLEEQFNQNARDFFSQSTNFAFDETTKTFSLSMMLQWYSKDFGTTDRERLRAYAPYMPNEVARAHAQQDHVTIQYLPYDWRLNDQITAEDPAK